MSTRSLTVVALFVAFCACGDSESTGSSATGTGTATGSGAGGGGMMVSTLCDMTVCADAMLPNTPGCPMTRPTVGGACTPTKGCNYCDGNGNFEQFLCDSTDVWSLAAASASCN